MNKRTLLAAALIGSCTLQGMAQHIDPVDPAGDKEYQQACQEYERKAEGAADLLRAYLKHHPDSRHANRVQALIASACFDEGEYEEAIGIFEGCDLEALPDRERDDCALRLATSYLKTGNLREAGIWFRLLEEVSTGYRTDAAYNLAYIDYAEHRYDKALKSFLALRRDRDYAALVPYYIGEIYLIKGDAETARTVADDYLARWAGHSDEAQMRRIRGEACYEQADYHEAIASLEAYTEATRHPQRKALYALGMSYYHTGVYSKAAATLGEATTVRDALAQNAYLHMGLSYLNLKERNRARMAFEQAAAQDDDRQVKEQALYNYALCIHETSYSPFAESVTVFERFLNEFPSSAYADRVNDYLVEVYLNTRSYDAALQSIAKIRQPGARILQAKQKILFRLGTQAFANADFAGAISYLDRSLAVGNYDTAARSDAYYWRGEANYRLGDYRQAGSDMRQFLATTGRRDGQRQFAYYTLGYVCFKQQDYPQALNWFRRLTDAGDTVKRDVNGDAFNRIGDCYFQNRRFEEAVKAYGTAAELNPALADYSLYQTAFVHGLQRDYRGKIQLLNRLLADYPESQYVDDALYEQGRAFVQLEDNANAIGRFQLLVQRFPESNLARRAASETGLLYYQDDKYTEAIAAYKNVVARYPGSEEARQAQRDLKSIYIDLNQVDEYAAFAATIPGGANFDVSERDSLTYVAAERVYMRGNTDEARTSFLRYLQTFPDGAFSLNAHYYVALADYRQKNYTDAIPHLDKVLEYPANKYSEEAMLMRAEIAFNEQDYPTALTVYKLLRDRASAPERRQAAGVGMLRSARLAGDPEETVLAATALLADAKLAPEVENEARYSRAKVHLERGDAHAAIDDLKALSHDTRNAYGAEARYRLAQLYFDNGQTADTEKEVLDYIEVSTPHTYWLARSFVLLADVYMKLGRNLDARQYLLSLKQNYQAEDDIAGMIEDRLEKLTTE